VAATGGTARHSLVLDHAMRPMFTYLHAVVVPTGVFAAAEDWGAGDGADRALAERIDRAAGELAALLAGPGGAGSGGAGSRERRAPAPDPYQEPTAFVDLLREHSGQQV